MNNFLKLLVNNWLVDLVHVLLMDYWLMELVDHWLMMLVNDVLMLLCDHVLMMFMDDILMSLLVDGLLLVCLHNGCRLVVDYLSLLLNFVDDWCFSVSHDLGLFLGFSDERHIGFHSARAFLK